MNIWDILGINPTEEVGAIKKAYAKKLKLHHPEEDPAGYQILREAYDEALKLAKNKKIITSVKSYESKDEVISEEEINKNVKSNNLNEVNFTEDIINKKRVYQNTDKINSIEDYYTIEDMERVIESFFDKVHNLYKDFQNRISVENWKEILSSDVLWNLDYKDVISKNMLNFLLHNPNIPKEVWLELNKTFYWNEEENYDRGMYDDYSVNFILEQMGNRRWFRYQYLSKKEGIDYDTFLEYRRLAFNALENNRFKEAENYLALANEIFQADPDLICMKAEVYVKKNDLRRAESLFKEAININNKDIETVFYIANIYYNNGYHNQAINFCKPFLKLYPDNIELRFLLGKFYLCNKKFNKLKKAEYIFLEYLNFETYASEARKYINLLINRYEALYYKEPWNLLIIKNLKKLYLALGEKKKAEQVKFKPRKLSSLISAACILATIIAFFYIGFSNKITYTPTLIPIHIAVKNITAKKVEITWNKVQGAEVYNVYRYDKALNDYKLVGVTKDARFSESKLEPYTEYIYKVASFKNGKEEIVSDPFRIKTEFFEAVPISKNEYASLVSSATEKKNIVYGNRGNNMVNNGLAVGSGDWLYFTDRDLQNSLYRMKKDGTKTEKLRDGYISNLNVVGDWIYFLDSSKLCKIKTDGSSYQVVIDNISANELIIIGDWIYFTEHGLYKITLDGSHRSKIISDNTAYFNIDGDWIYYSNITDKNKLYKVRLDGSENTKLSEDSCGFINISNGCIYYKNYYDGKVYKIKLDGTNKNQVTDHGVNYFNVIGDTIIYEGSGNLSKVTINGENESVITDNEYNCISIVDDYIFCYKYDVTDKYVFILKFKELLQPSQGLLGKSNKMSVSILV